MPSSYARILLVAALFVLSACEPSTPSGTQASARGTGFDFYVLALSWSPSYCAAEGENANRQQCNASKPYGFIVHGLWPQFEKGYPEFCANDGGRVDRKIEEEMRTIMPSVGLIRHQWKKHGTCSGLSQQDYFQTLATARDHITIPDVQPDPGQHRMVSPIEIERAFMKDNPGLAATGVAVTCDKRRLREVRICMTTNLEFRTCPEVDRRACRRKQIAMPPQRGR